jgi:hypothetical protein
MDNLFVYLQQAELLAFFSGYPLVYALVTVMAGAAKPVASKLARALPYAYALTATLFWGLQLKNLYPDYSVENIMQLLQLPLLQTWALLALLFWLPLLSRRPVLALLHSLVFFFLFLKGIFSASPIAGTNHLARNNMKLYADSLLLNFATLLIITAILFIISRLQSQQKKN